jgi:hypothetical protein
MRSPLPLSAILLVAGYLGGCGFFTDDQDILPIEHDVAFFVDYLYGRDTGPDLVVGAPLPPEGGCARFVTSVRRVGADMVHLTIHGYQVAEVCITKASLLDIHPFRFEDGTYRLMLHHRGETDLYHLTLDGREIGVETVKAEVSRYGRWVDLNEPESTQSR